LILKGGKMNKKIWMCLVLLLVMPGLLLVVSCAQQTATTKSSAVETPEEKAVETPEEKAVEEPEEKAAEKIAEAPVQEEQAQVVAQEVIKEEETAVQPSKKEKKSKSTALAEKLIQEEVEEVESSLSGGDDLDFKLRQAFIRQNVYFEYDKSTLLPIAQKILKLKAKYLFNNPDITVVVEGHCDERGTNEYNLALGDRRAESAKNFLVELGVLESRFTTISYGEERPLATAQDEEAWARNRRAHFVIE